MKWPQIPLGRFGTSEEIAATMLHLVPTESGFIVALEIIANGRDEPNVSWGSGFQCDEIGPLSDLLLTGARRCR